MALENCKGCGKVFMRLKTDICPECQKVEDEALNKVQKFLKENPKVDMDPAALSEETGVDEALILKFIRKNRLVVKTPRKTGEGGKLVCASCGTPILSGTLCRVCNNALFGERKATFVQQDPLKSKSQPTGMFTRSSKKDEK